MKNLFLLSFLFIVSISFSQVENYENAFFHNDTMKKYSKYEYSKTIKQIIKNEFVKEFKSNYKLKEFDNSPFSIVIVVDTTGTISLLEASNSGVFSFIEKIFIKLPKIKPFVNQHNIKNWFSIVMVFKLDSKFELPIEKDTVKDLDKFKILEKIPRFKNCNPILSNESMKNCFMEKMNNHIKDNFSYPKQAINDNIQGRTIALFTIEKDGTIEEITIVEGHPIIQSSTLDLILKLPPFIPGELNGEKTKVSYSQPIFYKLENKKRK
ncbi:energy transducer TonB [uncultured Flavobacterium sp.]|uniref:energy transducer TonB n=1 Tax=uncultured Flavobacterium sp. TaxID=165435 RepID=UPI0030EBB04A